MRYVFRCVVKRNVFSADLKARKGTSRVREAGRTSSVSGVVHRRTCLRPRGDVVGRLNGPCVQCRRLRIALRSAARSIAIPVTTAPSPGWTCGMAAWLAMAGKKTRRLHIRRTDGRTDAAPRYDDDNYWSTGSISCPIFLATPVGG